MLLFIIKLQIYSDSEVNKFVPNSIPVNSKDTNDAVTHAPIAQDNLLYFLIHNFVNTT